MVFHPYFTSHIFLLLLVLSLIDFATRLVWLPLASFILSFMCYFKNLSLSLRILFSQASVVILIVILWFFLIFCSSLMSSMCSVIISKYLLYIIQTPRPEKVPTNMYPPHISFFLCMYIQNPTASNNETVHKVILQLQYKLVNKNVAKWLKNPYQDSA